jgi:hypothetical protein
MEPKVHKKIKFALILAGMILQGFLHFGYAQNWVSLGNFDSNTRMLFSDSISNKLYVGGNFRQIDSNWSCRGIAAWNGTSFDSLGAGLDDVGQSGYPNDAKGIIHFDNKFLVYGGFRTAGNTTGNDSVWYMATWDGNQWENFYGGANGGSIVNGCKYNNGVLLVGGFDSIGGIAANKIAFFDGNNWSALPSFDSIAPYFSISDIQVFNSDIYVSGAIGNDSLFYNVLKLNTSNWEWETLITFESSFSGVYSLEVYKGELYAAGLFQTSWGNLENSIIRYDGVNWKTVGGGITSSSWASIYNMRVLNNELYVVGSFEQAGGIPAQCIAKWDGLQWCGFNSNFNLYPIFDVALYNNEIYIAGSFFTIDGDSIRGMAKYIGTGPDTCGAINVGVAEQIDLNSFIDIYPNPSTDFITVSSSNIQTELSVKIFNLLGELIFADTAKNNYSIDIGNWSNGIYVIQVSDGRNTLNQKIIKN